MNGRGPVKIPADIVRSLVGEHSTHAETLDWVRIADFEFRYPTLLLPLDAEGDYVPGPSLDIVVMGGMDPYFIRASGDCICERCSRGLTGST